MDDLRGKVAIVTGASKGIGAAIARQFAKAGAAVVVNYASSKDDADRVVGDILREGGKAVAIQANVSKGADVKRLFAETEAAFGTPSILVNNAGVYSFAPLEEVTEAGFHRQFDTNVLSTILTTREAAAAFGKDGGSVINLSTISSTNPVPNSVIYSASKSAVDAVTKALASDVRPPQDPRQCDCARHDRDRRPRYGFRDRGRDGQGHRGDVADGPAGTA
jgi:3-oxoacyl-[acyl-carrier protein] reductase